MEPMRRPPRLQKRNHRFYCRASVPRELRPIVGKTEIIRALKTADYSEALQRLPLASAEVNAELAEAISENRLDLTQLLDPDDPSTLGSVQGIVGELLHENGLVIEEDSPGWWKLCDLVRRAMIELTRRGIERLRGDFGGRHDPLFRGVDPADAPPEAPAQIGVTLEELIQMFLTDPTREAGSKDDSDYRVALRFLGEFIPMNAPVRQVTRDHCRQVASLLARMPANASKRAELKALMPLCAD